MLGGIRAILDTCDHLGARDADSVDLARATSVLDETAHHARLTLRFQGSGETALEPEADGVQGARGRLLAIVKAAISRTGPGRA